MQDKCQPMQWQRRKPDLSCLPENGGNGKAHPLRIVTRILYLLLTVRAPTAETLHKTVPQQYEWRIATRMLVPMVPPGTYSGWKVVEGTRMVDTTHYEGAKNGYWVGIEPPIGATSERFDVRLY